MRAGFEVLCFKGSGATHPNPDEQCHFILHNKDGFGGDLQSVRRIKRNSKVSERQLRGRDNRQAEQSCGGLFLQRVCYTGVNLSFALSNNKYDCSQLSATSLIKGYLPWGKLKS